MANLFNTGGVVVQTVINTDEVPLVIPITDTIDEGGEILYGGEEVIEDKDLGEK
jgi:hypothetical protein